MFAHGCRPFGSHPYGHSSFTVQSLDSILLLDCVPLQVCFVALAGPFQAVNEPACTVFMNTKRASNLNNLFLKAQTSVYTHKQQRANLAFMGMPFMQCAQRFKCRQLLYPSFTPFPQVTKVFRV